MISVIIPTLNRAYILKMTLPRYYEQDHVSELIIVDDGGSDNTEDVVKACGKNFPKINTKYIKHKKKCGAAAARNTGVKASNNNYILFGDDDALPSKDYTSNLYKKLIAHNHIAGVAGRWVQMLANESFDEAKQRFFKMRMRSTPFYKYLLMLNTEAYFEEDQILPILPPVLLTHKDILQQFPFDEKYCKGNGYREESTFQISAFNSGYDFLLTNEVHCFHLPKDKVISGGQRTTSLLTYYFWCIYFNHLFLKQYYPGYKKRLNIKMPKFVAELSFALWQLYVSVIKPLGSMWIKKPIMRFMGYPK